MARSRKVSTVGGLSLPSKKTKPLQELQQFSFWFYGPPKIGKSSLVSRFGTVCQAMTEKGYNALSIYDVPLWQYEWPDYLNFLELIKEDTFFDCVSLDVLEIAFEKCFAFMKAELGIENPQWGEWNTVRKPFIDLCTSLTMLEGKGCVFVSHASRVEREDASGETWGGMAPALKGKPYEAIAGLVDVIGCMHYHKGHRVMQIIGDSDIDAGCRLFENNVAFIDTEGERVKYIPLGTSSDEAYANFLRAFQNKQSPAHLEHIFPQHKESKLKSLRRKKTA